MAEKTQEWKGRCKWFSLTIQRSLLGISHSDPHGVSGDVYLGTPALESSSHPGDSRAHSAVALLGPERQKRLWFCGANITQKPLLVKYPLGCPLLSLIFSKLFISYWLNDRTEQSNSYFCPAEWQELIWNLNYKMDLERKLVAL